MKQGKNPTVAQKKRMAKYKLNPDNWLIVKDCREEFLIRHRESGATRSISKLKDVI